MIGVDDGLCRQIAETLSGPFDIARISVAAPVDDGVYAADGVLHEVMDRNHGRDLSAI